MKNIIVLFFLLFNSLHAIAQETEFYIDQQECQKFAKANDLKILMIFAGSDWCKPCIKFKRDILESDEFKNYSSGHLAILYLDFPAKKKNKLPKEQTEHNEALAEQYNKSGIFPKIILFDSGFNKIRDLNYRNQDAKSFVESLRP